MHEYFKHFSLTVYQSLTEKTSSFSVLAWRCTRCCVYCQTRGRVEVEKGARLAALIIFSYKVCLAWGETNDATSPNNLSYKITG